MARTISGGGYLVDTKCAKCGKIFVPAPQHVYRDNGKWYCTWTCYNHRKDEKKKKEKRMDLKNLKNTKALVQAILERDTRARNSDYFLYFTVLKTIATDKGVSLKRITITDFLLNEEISSLFPPFESVRRSRQKVQADFPELAATDRVEAGREINEKAYRDFARV